LVEVVLMQSLGLWRSCGCVTSACKTGTFRDLVCLFSSLCPTRFMTRGMSNNQKTVICPSYYCVSFGSHGFSIAQIPCVISFRQTCPIFFPPDPVEELSTPAARVRFKRRSRGVTDGSLSETTSGRSSAGSAPAAATGPRLVQSGTPGEDQPAAAAVGGGNHVVEMSSPDDNMSSVLPGAVR
jgi:hypothetical protein